MIEKKKFIRPHANVTYNIDGASYGMDDGLAEAIKNSISRKLASKTLEIPRLPHVAGRIIELSRNENADVDDIVQAIMTDPMLATRIMTLANSSAYAGGQTLQGLKPALMRIGSKAVQDMVFSESIRIRGARDARPSPGPCRQSHLPAPRNRRYPERRRLHGQARVRGTEPRRVREDRTDPRNREPRCRGSAERSGRQRRGLVFRTGALAPGFQAPGLEAWRARCRARMNSITPGRIETNTMPRTTSEKCSFTTGMVAKK